MEPLSRAFLESLDAADALAPLRAEFDLGGTLYFIGNSLGPPPRATVRRLREVVEREWRHDLIRGWNVHDWFHLPERIGDRIAQLIGAAPGEVVAGDSTSVSLFKLLAAAVRATGRPQVITDEANFPTDLHVLTGLQTLLGDRLEVMRLPADRIAAAVTARTALVTLTHVDYRTSRLHDMAGLTAAAHAHGAWILWDLSHSTGAVPVDVNGSRVDFAVGCTYKFLNGGPGAPSYAFVARRHHAAMLPVLRGWMGHAAPFSLSGDYEPASGARRYVAGTPEVLALSAVAAGLDLFERAGIDAIRAKSLRMSGVLMELIESECAGYGIDIATPREPGARGSHVAVRHPEAYAVMQALIARDIVGDFRAPDLMRFAITPLYQRYVDLWDLASALREILETGAWDTPEFRRRATVT
jgi:kynureninase